MAPRDPRHRTSASPTSSATTGSWPRSSASTSRSTSRWTASATRRCRSRRSRDMDLLYPNTTYVHASHFTDEEWALVRDSGGNVSFAPADRGPDGPRLGAGGDGARVRHADRAVVRRGHDGAVRPVHPDALDLRLGARPQAPGGVGRGPRRARGRRPGLITSRQVLRWATLGGAKVAGIADRTGSITPGKKADIVIIDGSAVNVAPIIDPVGAVVCAADVSNVKTVLVDGEILKEDFRLKASLDAPRKARRGVARLPALEVRRARARLADGLVRSGGRLRPADSGTFQRSVTGDVPRSFGRSVLPPGPTARACSGPAAAGAATGDRWPNSRRRNLRPEAAVGPIPVARILAAECI